MFFNKDRMVTALIELLVRVGCRESEIVTAINEYGTMSEAELKYVRTIYEACQQKLELEG